MRSLTDPGARGNLRGHLGTRLHRSAVASCLRSCNHAFFTAVTVALLLPRIEFSSVLTKALLKPSSYQSAVITTAN